MPPPTPHDWTAGPAKWAAVALLGAASVFGMTWSILTRRHAAPARVHLGEQHAAPAPSQAGGPADAPPSSPVPGTPPPPVSAGISAAEQPASAAAPVEQAEPSPDPGPSPPPTPASVVRKINLNTATAAELDLLPGIGPALAQRIIAERAARGRFTTIDDLDRVRGIGPRTMAKLRPLVTVE